ncbi:hypothetical protein GF322_03565 [Candidatus Dependentiae bacterium]|nr:hypothetical protein [Candidatus Dependentiae bacterium]
MKFKFFFNLFLFISYLLVMGNTFAKTRIVFLFGDTHVGASAQHPDIVYKEKYKEIILNLKNDNVDNFVIIPGDLTHDGFIDSEKVEGCLPCFSRIQVTDWRQWDGFVQEWVVPFEVANMSVYFGIGDHDYPNRAQYVRPLDQIYGRYKKLSSIITNNNHAYVFKKGNTYFFCCGLYPDSKIRQWLVSYLRKNNINNQPLYFFYHYNNLGDESNLWSNADKDAFYELIKDYNVKAIITSHWFNTFTALWREKKIPLLGVNGKFFAQLEFDDVSGDFKVQFYSVNGEMLITKNFNDLLRNDLQELDRR